MYNIEGDLLSPDHDLSVFKIFYQREKHNLIFSKQCFNSEAFSAWGNNL